MLSSQKLTQRRVVLIVMLLAGVISVTAQERDGRLRGRITDQAGALIAGATVSLTDANGKQTSAVANGAGEYVFQNLRQGRYTVQATMTGFAAYENSELTIVSGQSHTLDILLPI